MKSNGKILVSLLLMIMLMVSCKTSEPLYRGVILTGEEQLEAIVSNTPVFDSFSSRLRLTLPLNGEEKTVNGTLKMKRDERIQISLVLPVIRTEAARIEITPERVTILDRMNKVYTSVPVSELRSVFNTEIDYPMLQALFANQIFVPGSAVLSSKQLASFGIDRKAEGGVLLSKKTPEFFLSFFAPVRMNRLTESIIENTSGNYRMQWKYDTFVRVSNTTFPSEMTVSLASPDNFMSAFMELSRLSVDKVNITPVNIPSRYQEVSLDDLLKMLLSV